MALPSKIRSCGFPAPGSPERNPRHIRACAHVRVKRGTGRRSGAVRVSNSGQPMRSLFWLRRLSDSATKAARTRTRERAGSDCWHPSNAAASRSGIRSSSHFGFWKRAIIKKQPAAGLMRGGRIRSFLPATRQLSSDRPPSPAFLKRLYASSPHLSLKLPCRYRSSGDMTYSMIRRVPVLISTVTAMPGARLTSLSSTCIWVSSSATRAE